MSQFCVISFRFCTGAPMYLVSRDGVLAGWSFEIAKAREYQSVMEADPHFQWVVDSFKNGKASPKVFPAVMAPLQTKRFSIIEIAIDRLVLGKRCEQHPMRRVHIDLQASTRRVTHVIPDPYHPARASHGVAANQSRSGLDAPELLGSVPRKRSVGV